MFLERLELYVSAGLPLDRALMVSGQASGGRQKACIENVRKHVEAGGLLWKGLSDSIRIGRTTAGLIEHGESSGQLVKAFKISRSLLDKEDQLRSKCVSAMAYPAVIGAFAVILTIGLVRGVMPQIIPMLKGLHVGLPFLTRMIIFISDILSGYGLWMMAAIMIMTAVSRAAYVRFEKLQHLCQSVLLLVPLAGGLVRSYSLAVFLRSCGSLIESGSPIKEAYASSAGSLPLRPLRKDLEAGIERIGMGMPLSRIMTGRHIPKYVSPLLAAGEASGTLGLSAGRAAEILDRDIEDSLKRLTALIEPIMMIGIGVVVGAIALSIMMPIYEISKILQR